VLVITRQRGERIVIGGDITLTVMDIRGDKVRLGIASPPQVPVHRQEVFEAIHGPRPQPPRPRPAQEQAFVQAILESPDDEGIRLIFADWLDDHDNPFGEFIRVQCRLAHLPEKDEARQELLQREQFLLAAHAEEWREYLPAILHGERFERGFVESVHLTVPKFLAHADEIFAATPLRRLCVQDSMGDEVAALAASPHLARLARLDLRARAHNWIGPAEAKALAQSPHLENLQLLVVTGNPLGDGAVTLQVRFGKRVRL
jgi:carbon storage regulator CsrA